MVKETESFRSLLEYPEPNIAMASETWLNPTIVEREALPESYRFVARRDRPNSSHGGVAIIARQDLEASETDLHYYRRNCGSFLHLQGLKETHNCL